MGSKVYYDSQPWSMGWRLGHFLSPGANSRGADSGFLQYQRPSGFVRHLFSQLVSLGGVVESAKLTGLEHLVETMAFSP